MQAEGNERPAMTKQLTSETPMEPKHSQIVQNKMDCLDSQQNHNEDKDVQKYKLGMDGQTNRAQSQSNIPNIDFNEWQILH